MSFGESIIYNVGILKASACELSCYLGPNAVRVIRDIGVLDEVLAECDSDSERSFSFYMGAEGHEFVYDVSLFWCCRVCITLCLEDVSCFRIPWKT